MTIYTTQTRAIYETELDDEDFTEPSLADMVISFLLDGHRQDAIEELLPVACDLIKLDNHPLGTFAGIGTILHWYDPIHAISYSPKSGCLHTLTCCTPSKHFLFSVLDAYTFWKDADIVSILHEYKLPQHAGHRNTILTDATQRTLGEWGEENLFGSNWSIMRLLRALDIDMYEINNRQRVSHAYLMEQARSDKSNSSNSYWYIGKYTATNCEAADESGRQPVMWEKIYRYADIDSSDNIVSNPCSLICPLAAMHVVADCICSDNCVHDEHAAAEQQIEICERPGDFLANGCLADKGMVIYRCTESRC